MNRTPPKSVLEELRREANFGCPVSECGVPYLTWHHFDPPFHVEPHHNPEGMIAICPLHHSLAEGSRWTTEQLREMKNNPFLKNKNIRDEFGYLRKNIVCNTGFYTVNVRSIIEVDNEEVIGFEKDDEGYNRLNINIKDETGSDLLKMKNNFWEAYSTKIFDLICTAQGRELKIISKSKNINFSLRFDEINAGVLKGKVIEDEIRAISKRDSYVSSNQIKRSRDLAYEYFEEFPDHSLISLLTVRGKLVYKSDIIEIRDTGFSYNTNTFSDMKMKNFRTALSFKNGGFSMGVP